MLFLLLFLGIAASLTPQDKERFKDVLRKSPTSLKEAYQLIVSQNLLNVVDSSICKFASKNMKSNLDDAYYASYIYKIAGCSSLRVKDDVIRGELESDNIKNIFKAATALSNFGYDLEESVMPAVLEHLKKEDTVMAYSLAYLVSSLYPGDVPKELSDSVEDIAHRADTVGDAMSFEGGLIETSMFLKGALAVSAKVKTALLSEAMVQKFSNYVLGNKYKQNLVNLFYTLTALESLSNNGVVVPTRFEVLDNSATFTKDLEFLKVAIMTPLGVTVSNSKLSVKSAISPLTGDTLFEKDTLTSEDGVFNIAKTTSKRGIYNVEIEGSVPTGFVSPSNAKFPAKVIVDAKISTPMLKLVNIDDNRVLMQSDLTQAPLTVKADISTRFTLDFYVSDGTDNIAIHQAFVRFTNKQTNQDVFFIAQADLTKKYAVDLNFRTTAAKSFKSVGGKYQIDLIVGDATIAASQTLDVATLTLDIPDSKDSVPSLSRAAKPEITHVFREKEKRPPQAVSIAFTILVFLPALAVIIAWAKLGVNVSNFKISIASIGFHAGLVVIMAIYVNFFLGVDMFVTIKCLSIVSIVTFLCGNRLLSSIAAAKKVK